jgi:host factor-I protein
MSTVEPQQDTFLNAMRREQKPVRIYLVNGIGLAGYIQSFDKYMVMLASPAGVQSIYKHAVATIQVESGERRTAPHRARAEASGTDTAVVTRRRRLQPGGGNVS